MGATEFLYSPTKKVVFKQECQNKMNLMPVPNPQVLWSSNNIASFPSLAGHQAGRQGGRSKNRRKQRIWSIFMQDSNLRNFPRSYSINLFYRIINHTAGHGEEQPEG